MLLTSKATRRPNAHDIQHQWCTTFLGKQGLTKHDIQTKTLAVRSAARLRICQNQIEIYAPSRLADSGERWRGKPSVLLADTQSRHATQTMPEHPQTTAKCTHTSTSIAPEHSKIRTLRPDWYFKRPIISQHWHITDILVRLCAKKLKFIMH